MPHASLVSARLTVCTSLKHQVVAAKMKMWKTAKDWGLNNLAILAACAFLHDRGIIGVLKGAVNPYTIVAKRDNEGKLHLEDDEHLQ